MCICTSPFHILPRVSNRIPLFLLSLFCSIGAFLPAGVDTRRAPDGTHPKAIQARCRTRAAPRHSARSALDIRSFPRPSRETHPATAEQSRASHNLPPPPPSHQPRFLAEGYANAANGHTPPVGLRAGHERETTAMRLATSSDTYGLVVSEGTLRRPPRTFARLAAPTIFIVFDGARSAVS